MDAMRVIVCGGRDFTDREAVFRTLMPLFVRYGRAMTIIEGGARGADASARAFAYEVECQLETFRADWRAYGRRAGPLRNEEMLRAGPDLVIAFPGGKGTRDMVDRAAKAGIPVREVLS